MSGYHTTLSTWKIKNFQVDIPELTLGVADKIRAFLGCVLGFTLVLHVTKGGIKGKWETQNLRWRMFGRLFQGKWAPEVVKVRFEVERMRRRQRKLVQTKVNEVFKHLTLKVFDNEMLFAGSGDNLLKEKTVFFATKPIVEKMEELFPNAEDFLIRAVMMLGVFQTKPMRIKTERMAFVTTFGDVMNELLKRLPDQQDEIKAAFKRLDLNEELPEGELPVAKKKLDMTQIRFIGPELVAGKGACRIQSLMVEFMDAAGLDLFVPTECIKSVSKSKTAEELNELYSKLDKKKKLVVGVKSPKTGLRFMASSHFVSKVLELGGHARELAAKLRLLLKGDVEGAGYQVGTPFEKCTDPFALLRTAFTDNNVSQEKKIEALRILNSSMGGEFDEDSTTEAQVPLALARTGLDLMHPMIRKGVEYGFGRKLAAHVVGLGLYFRASRVHSDWRLKRNEICCPDLPDGAKVVVLRYPVVGIWSLQVFINRHLPDVTDCIVVGFDVMPSVLGDLDGDWLGVNDNSYLVEAVEDLHSKFEGDRVLNPRDNDLIERKKVRSPLKEAKEKAIDIIMNGFGWNVTIEGNTRRISIGAMTNAALILTDLLANGEFHRFVQASNTEKTYDMGMKLLKDFAVLIDVTVGAFKNHYHIKNVPQLKRKLKLFDALLDPDNGWMPNWLEFAQENRGNFYRNLDDFEFLDGDDLITNRINQGAANLKALDPAKSIYDKEWDFIREIHLNVAGSFKASDKVIAQLEGAARQAYGQAVQAFLRVSKAKGMMRADHLAGEITLDEYSKHMDNANAYLRASLNDARAIVNEVTTDRAARLYMASMMLETSHPDTERVDDEGNVIESRGSIPFVLMPNECLALVRWALKHEGVNGAEVEIEKRMGNSVVLHSISHDLIRTFAENKKFFVEVVGEHTFVFSGDLDGTIDMTKKVKKMFAEDGRYEVSIDEFDQFNPYELHIKRLGMITKLS